MQVPWEVVGPFFTTTGASVTATLAGETSAPQTVAIAPYAPGIFTINAQGTGPGAILDSSYRLISPSNPAGAGLTVILIYCTGLGAVSNQPATGAAASSSTLSHTLTTPTVMIGGVPAQVLFSGLAPGTVGEYQVNAVVPANAPTGNAVPVVISMGGAMSNSVQIAVATADARADLLLAQMTQEEKIQLVYGAGGPVTNNPALLRGAAGFVPGIYSSASRVSISPMAAWAWVMA